MNVFISDINLHKVRCVVGIYAVREETSVVDMFIFDILVTYVESLLLAHDDDKVLGLFHIFIIIIVVKLFFSALM